MVCSMHKAVAVRAPGHSGQLKTSEEHSASFFQTEFQVGNHCVDRPNVLEGHGNKAEYSPPPSGRTDSEDVRKNSRSPKNGSLSGRTRFFHEMHARSDSKESTYALHFARADECI